MWNRAAGLTIAALLVVAIAACSEASTTGTAPPPATTATDSTISTTTASTSTTTSALLPSSSTTSTLAPAPPPNGAAAVVINDSIFGWWSQEEGWSSTVPEMAQQISGLESFQGFDLAGAAGTHVGQGLTGYNFCEDIAGSEKTTDWPFIDFGDERTRSQVLVAADWDVQPGQAIVTEAGSSLYEAGHEFLAAQGLDDPTPSFSQVLATDLDRDGTEETLVVLDRDAGLPADIDNHSFVLLVEGGMDAPTVSVAFEDLITEEDRQRCPNLGDDDYWQDNYHCAPLQVAVSAIVDIDGDGVDEVLTGDWAGYEALFTFDPTTREFTTQFERTCGNN